MTHAAFSHSVRNTLITGGNSGIGLEMARALARAGDAVIITGRDAAKNTAALDDVRTSVPGATIDAMPLDLAEFDDIDRFAEAVRARFGVIDRLLFNAGLYTTHLHRLPNGYEAMMGVMHFGHFRLLRHLLPSVQASPRGRIVYTSSMIHALGRIDPASFKDPSQHRSGLHAYGQAKLANLLTVRELARRLAGTSTTAHAFHPGAVATGIYRELPAPLRPLVTMFMRSPARGADTAVWLATQDALPQASGGYYVDRKLKPGSASSRDAALATQLWVDSEAAM